MTINQVKKLRKIVRIKKLATKDTKLFVCTMKKTSVCYRMVLIYLPTIFFPMHTISILRNDIYAYLCIQSFPKKFIDDSLSTHLYGQEARKVFVQHPCYNIEVFLKRANDGWAIIHRRWAKVQRPSTFSKAQFSHSASTVSQMRFICLSTDYDDVLCKGCYTADLMLLYCGLVY